jgi:hypothetical protein
MYFDVIYVMRTHVCYKTLKYWIYIACAAVYLFFHLSTTGHLLFVPPTWLFIDGAVILKRVLNSEKLLLMLLICLVCKSYS